MANSGIIHSGDGGGKLVFKADTRGGKYSLEVREKNGGYTIYDYKSGGMSGMGGNYSELVVRDRIINTILDSKKIDSINYIIEVDEIGVSERLERAEKVWVIENGKDFIDWKKALAKEKTNEFSRKAMNDTSLAITEGIIAKAESEFYARWIYKKEVLLEYLKQHENIKLANGGMLNSVGQDMMEQMNSGDDFDQFGDDLDLVGDGNSGNPSYRETVGESMMDEMAKGGELSSVFRKTNTYKGYDFYVGKDAKGKLVYNIVPAGSAAPAGGYGSKLFIAGIKRVSDMAFSEVDGFVLVYEKWSTMMGGNGTSGTIRTSPESYYVATVGDAGELSFDGIEANTKNIDTARVKKMYDKGFIPSSLARGGEVNYEILEPSPLKVIGFLEPKDRKEQGLSIYEPTEWDKQHGAEYRIGSYRHDQYVFDEATGKLRNNPLFWSKPAIKISANQFMLMGDDEGWDSGEKIGFKELVLVPRTRWHQNHGLSQWYAYKREKDKSFKLPAAVDAVFEKGGSVGKKTYFLNPYIERAGTSNMLEAQPKLSKQMEASLDEAIEAAKLMIEMYSNVEEVSVVRIGKSVLKNKKVALVTRLGSVTKFENGGDVSDVEKYAKGGEVSKASADKFYESVNGILVNAQGFLDDNRYRNDQIDGIGVTVKLRNMNGYSVEDAIAKLAKKHKLTKQEVAYLENEFDESWSNKKFESWQGFQQEVAPDTLIDHFPNLDKKEIGFYGRSAGHLVFADAAELESDIDELQDELNKHYTRDISFMPYEEGQSFRDFLNDVTSGKDILEKANSLAEKIELYSKVVSFIEDGLKDMPVAWKQELDFRLDEAYQDEKDDLKESAKDFALANQKAEAKVKAAAEHAGSNPPFAKNRNLIIVNDLQQKYRVNYLGHITQYGNKDFSGNWKLVGLVRVDYSLGDTILTLEFNKMTEEAIAQKVANGYHDEGKLKYTIRDRDYGTLREWGNHITNMHFEDVAGAPKGDGEKFHRGGDVKKSVLGKEYFGEFTLKGNGHRKYNIFQLHGDDQCRQAAKKLFPSMSYAEHKKLADKYFNLYKQTYKLHWETIEKEFKKQFGRDYHATDYKVSGIARDEFSEDVKKVLRGYLDKMGELAAAMDVHNCMLNKSDKVSRQSFEQGGELETFSAPQIGAQMTERLVMEEGGSVAKAYKYDDLKDLFKAGDKFRVHGWIMLKGVDEGDYEVTESGETAMKFVKLLKGGKKPSAFKKPLHFRKVDLFGSLNTFLRGDLNGVELLESSIVPIISKFENGGSISDSFQTGTPAVYHRYNYNNKQEEVSGEIVMRNDIKGISLYRDRNYSGSGERFVVPNWENVESFSQANKRQQQDKVFNIVDTKLVKGGSVSSVAKVLVISSKNPLSSQLSKLTGDSYNAIDFEDLDAGNPTVVKHLKTGQIFVVFTSNYFMQVDKHVIEDNLSYVKSAYHVSSFDWVDKAIKHEDGGSVASDEKPKFDDRVLMGYNDYCNAIYNSSEGGLNKATAQKEFVEYNKMQDDLNEGRITPAKVVGGGYKNGRKVAELWIKAQIEKMQKILDTNGKSNIIIQSNFISNVASAKNTGAITSAMAAKLLFDMGEYLPASRKEYAESLLAQPMAHGGEVALGEILIKPKHAHRDDVEELITYLDDNSWSYKRAEAPNGELDYFVVSTVGVHRDEVAEIKKWLEEQMWDWKAGEPEANDNLVEFTIPEWALSALVNGDYSGLNEEDTAKLEKFIESTVEEYGNANFSPASEEGYDLGFKHFNDIDNLGSNCFQLVLLKSNGFKKGGSITTEIKGLKKSEDAEEGDIIEIGVGYYYKVLKTWDGLESGRTDLPVVWASIHRVNKNGELLKSEKPKNHILKFKYENGGEVGEGTILYSSTGVPQKVLEYDAKFGGRVKVKRNDEFGEGVKAGWIPLSKLHRSNPIATSSDPRIEKMLKNWKEIGKAFSALNNDDNEFFEKVGVPYDKLGITSQTGNDIVYYDTNIWDIDLRKKSKMASGGGLDSYDAKEQQTLASMILSKSDGHMSPNESVNYAKSYDWTKSEHGDNLDAAADEIIGYWKEEREEKKNNPTLKKVVDAINKGSLKILRGGEKMFGKLKLSITELVWARNFEDGFNIDVYENGSHVGQIALTASTDWKPKVSESYAKGGSVKNELGQVKESVSDIEKIECYYNFSVRGNANQIKCDKVPSQMIDDYCVYLSDKEFLEKYSKEVPSSFDDDDFEENGSVDEFRVTQEYYITFNDGSELYLDFGMPDYNFLSADARDAEERTGTLAEKWLPEFNKDGWDMDIDSLVTAVEEESGESKMAKGGALSLFTYDTAPEFVVELNSGINSAWKSVQVSSLGGKENVSIILKISIDPRDKWTNGILHNSRYAMFHIHNNGVIECFSRPFRMGKFRKTTVETWKQVIEKINKYVQENSTVLEKGGAVIDPNSEKADVAAQLEKMAKGGAVPPRWIGKALRIKGHAGAKHAGAVRRKAKALGWISGEQPLTIEILERMKKESKGWSQVGNWAKKIALAETLIKMPHGKHVNK